MSLEKRVKIIEMLQKMSQYEIVKETGISSNTVQDIQKKLADIVNILDTKKIGRTWKLDKRDQRKLVRLSVSTP